MRHAPVGRLTSGNRTPADSSHTEDAPVADGRGQIQHSPVPLPNAGPRGDPVDDGPQVSVGRGRKLVVEPVVPAIDTCRHPIDGGLAAFESHRTGRRGCVETDPRKLEQAFECRGNPAEGDNLAASCFSVSALRSSPRGRITARIESTLARESAAASGHRRQSSVYTGATVVPRERWRRTRQPALGTDPSPRATGTDGDAPSPTAAGAGRTVVPRRIEPHPHHTRPM